VSVRSRSFSLSFFGPPVRKQRLKFLYSPDSRSPRTGPAWPGPSPPLFSEFRTRLLLPQSFPSSCPAAFGRCCLIVFPSTAGISRFFSLSVVDWGIFLRECRFPDQPRVILPLQRITVIMIANRLADMSLFLVSPCHWMMFRALRTLLTSVRPSETQSPYFHPTGH